MARNALVRKLIKGVDVVNTASRVHTDRKRAAKMGQKKHRNRDEG